jgi:predicted Zn-dependent protease
MGDQQLPDDRQTCVECAEGRSSVDLPDRELAAATEVEVAAALRERWDFVTSPPLASYIEGVTRRIASCIDGAPDVCRVVLIEDWSVRCLALPSGTLLISLGVLEALEDEAELAFFLAHELAHATSGEAAVRLVRQGFHNVARCGEATGNEAWARAALDMVKLGYGQQRERSADATALEAVLALGYDPGSVLRWFDRLQRRMERGDPQLRDYAFAHPAPSNRRREIERALFGRVDAGSAGRVNREVFRRAAGRGVLASGLVPLSPDEELSRSSDAVPSRSLLRSPLFWTASVVLLVAALLLLLVL